MPNGPTHRVVAGTVAFVATAHLEAKRGQLTLRPLAAGCLAAAAGTLPDLLEPAVHPHHRQFFHCFAVMALIGYGIWQAHKRWQPQSEPERWFKTAVLVLGGAYLIHLGMDALTKHSLPLLGKL